MPELLTLSALCARFTQAALVEGNTKDKVECSVRKLTNWGGNIVAQELTDDMIAQWQVWMDGQGLANATVRGYFAAVSQLYAWAKKRRILDENPFAGAEKIRKSRLAVQLLAEDEIAALSDAAAVLDVKDPAARVRWVFMLELAVLSGLRVGEIWNLRWTDIDLDKETATIQYRSDCPGLHWRWGAKGRTHRVVPIFQTAVEAAYRLKEFAPWLYPTLKRTTCLRMQGQVGKLSERQRKNPYNNFYLEFRQITAYANGLLAAAGRPPIKNGGLHPMRHTAISWWLRDGATVPQVQYVAGHASATTTMDIYAHVTEQEAVESVRRNLKPYR